MRKELESLFEAEELSEDKVLYFLLRIQERFGYLPPEALRELAARLNISPARIYGVATFYNQFRFSPPGRHHLRVCMGTACHLAGGKLILEALERELGIKVGERTPDGEFSLERVACVGCCALAPVVMAGDKVFGRLNQVKVEEMLVLLRGQEGEKGVK